MKSIREIAEVMKPIVLSICLMICCPKNTMAQADVESQRLEQIQNRFNNLAIVLPGLKQKVQMNLSGVSIQEFLRALAQANNLNINIDPSLNFKVYNNFTNETAQNILLFLAKEYHLDINLIGSIMTVTKVPELKVLVPVKEINASYNATSNTLSLELNNDSLVQVARKITMISGKNVVVPIALLGKKVTGYLSGAPFDTALEKLAFANELKLIRTNDQVYVFQPLEENEEVYVNAEKNTSVRRNQKTVSVSGLAAGASGAVAASGLPSGRQGGNFRVQSRVQAGKKLLSVDALNVPIAELVKAAAEELNLNYFLYSEIKGNISTRVNDISYEDLLFSLFHSTDYTFKKEKEVYLIGDRKLEGLRSHKLVQLQYRSLDTVQNMIPAEWKKGVEVKEFREQNTILLSGASPQVNEIESMIKQLDRMVPMVLIEVTMIDIRKGKSIKTGIKMGTSDSVRTGGTVFPALDYTFGSRSINDFLDRLGRNSSINLGRVTPNFYVSLSALESNSNVDVRSVPKLSTLNGHSASLSIGSKKYYSTTTQNVIPSLTSQTVITQQFTPVEANLDINIKPVVSGDNQVTLNIKVNISDFVGDTPLNQPPPTSTSKFESIVRAKNEDMIVLGGIERTESSDSGSGVPVLSRIPILKWLFSSRTKGTSKVVTVVFIKPTIIY